MSTVFLQPALDLDFSQCQRWRSGRDSYRPAGELFDPRYAAVELIDVATAKDFVTRHHYSRSMPASRCNVGIFIKEPGTQERLCGVATFSVPMTQAVIPAYFEGLDPRQGVELGRFVLTDELAANAETWFLARAFRKLREKVPEIRGVISYVDPLPRFTVDGRIVKRGHIGTSMKAFNGKYRGRSRARTLLISPDGLVANERSISKVRNNESGADGVVRDLVRMGAPERNFGENGKDWIARLVNEGFLRRQPHPGNFCFSWNLR